MKSVKQPVAGGISSKGLDGGVLDEDIRTLAFTLHFHQKMAVSVLLGSERQDLRLLDDGREVVERLSFT